MLPASYPKGGQKGGDAASKFPTIIRGWYGDQS
jgi:hypothetical protein